MHGEFVRSNVTRSSKKMLSNIKKKYYSLFFISFLKLDLFHNQMNIIDSNRMEIDIIKKVSEDELCLKIC